MDLTFPSYVSLDDYASLAAQIPVLRALAAATDDQRNADFIAATRDIDSAGPYQGRKFDRLQKTEFPRIKGDLQRTLGSGWLPLNGHLPGHLQADVWEWDPDTLAAVTPLNVKLATLLQAEARRSGKLAERRERLGKGLVSKSTGTLSETYSSSQPRMGPDLILWPDALAIMNYYRHHGGPIL